MVFCGGDVLLGQVPFRESYLELLVIKQSMHQIRIRRRTVGAAYCRRCVLLVLRTVGGGSRQTR